MKRVMIMAGGTGGHVFPALTIAAELVQHDIEIIWLGTPRGIEQRLVPAHNYTLLTVPVKGLRGYRWWSWLLAPARILFAMVVCWKFFRHYKPDLVLGMGGFASGPGGLVAWLQRIPLLIHEQNAIAGTTNRVLFHFSKRVMQAFPQTFPPVARVLYTGNPVRVEIRALHRKVRKLHCEEHDDINVLVLGGSQGARRLNQRLPQCFATLLTELSLNIRHQTGERHLQSTYDVYAKNNVSAELFTFVEDMATLYLWADLVICRAGAMSIAELTAIGVGAVLVPFPFAVDDHQTANANWLCAAGAAVLLAETTLETTRFYQRLRELLVKETLVQMGQKAHALFREDTVDLITRNCLEYVNA